MHAERIQTKGIFHISREVTNMRPHLSTANLTFSNVPMSYSYICLISTLYSCIYVT